MRKALSLALPVAPASLLWPLLAGELGFALLLVSADGIPAAAIRALQLFLRF